MLNKSELPTNWNPGIHYALLVAGIISLINMLLGKSYKRYVWQVLRMSNICLLPCDILQLASTQSAVHWQQQHSAVNTQI